MGEIAYNSKGIVPKTFPLLSPLLQIKGIYAELAAFFYQLVQNLALNTPIHSFVVIRSQHLKWQK